MKQILFVVFFTFCIPTKIFPEVPDFKKIKVEKAIVTNIYTKFISSELQYSLDAIQFPGTMPDTLMGEPTGGDFSFAGFALTLQRYSLLTGKNTLGDYNLDDWVKSYILKEIEVGGKTFAQLYVAKVLGNSCKVANDLTTSALWNSFSETQKKEINRFLDVTRFWDEAKDDLGGRPNNYYGVALYIEAYSNALKITSDPDRYRRIMAKCISILKKNDGVLDDSSRKLTDSFDRYMHEYIRYVWEATEIVDDRANQKILEPWVKTSANLWWMQYSNELGTSSLWGRSRQNSWDDTFEQVGFYAAHSKFAPANLKQLSAAYLNALNYYFENEYNDKIHLNRMLDQGRATWSYAGRNRIWSYTMGTFSNICYSLKLLDKGLDENQMSTIPTRPKKGSISTIHRFNAKNGVWILQNSNRNIALPFVGNGATSDYLPVPYGLKEIELPVEVTLPVLIPFLTDDNGDDFTICQGADQVKLVKRNSIELKWNDLQTVKGNTSDKKIRVTSTWEINKHDIKMNLIFEPQKSMTFKKFDFRIPLSESFDGTISFTTPWTLKRTEAIPDMTIYRGGAFRRIEKLVCFEGNQISMEAGKIYELLLTINHKNHE